MKSAQCAVRSIAILLCLIQFCMGGFHKHDQSFTPDYVLEATAQNITINCQTRYSVVVNGTSPGPTIYMKEGLTTWVRVWNRIPDQNFTMHWHGLTQRTAPFSDGTPLVSQWPIKPGEFFDYEIRPEVGDAGTYFYHSHVGFQQVTAHGALIVEDAEEPPYDYDDERLLTFADYYPKTDATIERGLTADPFTWSGEPAAIAMSGNSGNASFSNATDRSCTPHIINVEPGKTYRFRVIGKTAISLVKFAIEQHNELDIIEADGQYTKPTRTDHVQVSTGQRFSILFTAKTAEEILASQKTTYWIRYESRDRPTVVTGYALLRYKMPHTSSQWSNLPQTLPGKSPITLPNTTYDWLEYAFTPLKPHGDFPPLSEVTRTIYITMNQVLLTGNYVNKTINGSLAWAQNNLTWRERDEDRAPRPPYLITAYSQDTTPNYTVALSNNGYDPTVKAWPALVGETIDIVWQSNSGPTAGFDFHPMHAHGEHYWDLGSGNGTYDAALNDRRHFRNGSFVPARRDTTILYRYATSSPSPFETSGWRAWRIRVTPDNVGAWMMHCHIAQHSVMGMNTVWVFGAADDITREYPALPYVNGYLEYGGSAYGNDSYDPLVNHYFDD